MKKHILTLIIGILIGAILTTGVFLVLKSKESRRRPDFSQMPSMNYGERGSRNESSQAQNNEGNE
ncbi:MAG: hypothetical protein ACSW8B_03465 [bacterium]